MMEIIKASLMAAVMGGGGANLGTKTVTANGTYAASDDSLDGYSEVTVNVPTTTTMDEIWALPNIGGNPLVTGFYYLVKFGAVTPKKVTQTTTSPLVYTQYKWDNLDVYMLIMDVTATAFPVVAWKIFDVSPVAVYVGEQYSEWAIGGGSYDVYKYHVFAPKGNPTLLPFTVSAEDNYGQPVITWTGQSDNLSVTTTDTRYNYDGTIAETSENTYTGSIYSTSFSLQNNRNLGDSRTLFTNLSDADYEQEMIKLATAIKNS